MKDKTLTLFNTETRNKEPILSRNPSMYACGPTVYDFAHIGNFRSYVFEDLLRRTLEFFGYKVTHVMNITDVDDKTIRGAIKKGVSLKEYVKPFEDAFFKDIETLNIKKAHHYPKATQYIPKMIEMIQTLLDKGVAYQGKDGSVYFSIKKFPRYGCLSHLNLDELQAGASERVSTDEYDKDHVSDFVLWKAYDEGRDGNIYWESPFGKGRPGWHIECSTMAISLLGETIDIHLGGVDNMFPHHENEIAQSECFSGKRFVKHWAHAEHLLVDNKKMSKSLGNFYTLRDLLDRGYEGKQVRLMLLQTHYRTQLNFTFQELDAVKQSLKRLQDFIFRLQQTYCSEGSSLACQDVLDRAYEKFSNALADDLNISAALAAVFDMVREINTLYDQGKIGQQQAQEVLKTLKVFNTVLACLDFDQSLEVPEEVKDLFERRCQARKEKNWEMSDILRDALLKKGFIVEDCPTGSRLKKV